ncbi:hypothetical protein HmCmsJML048_04611 [Escherichia coli]|uniref:Uncharacterized protein n=1 Tax=Enterobacter roggenkampii TaxID=1812935 RepID=A0AAU9CFG0_9ENTR|nr:hypothetical protein OIPHN260_35600 [Enterobacter roggenkampii]GCV81542.1 hypothetical protein HmCmsJML048_04611 [Escherichia coli]
MPGRLNPPSLMNINDMSSAINIDDIVKTNNNKSLVFNESLFIREAYILYMQTKTIGIIKAYLDISSLKTSNDNINTYGKSNFKSFFFLYLSIISMIASM